MINIPIRTIQSLLSHPKITFMLELEGVSQQIATASLKECYYLQRTDLFFYYVSIFLFNFEMLMFVFGYQVRREKISEMLTLLQDLVPGSSRITGKAVSLDEIINYVQSLERQVEV